MVKRYVTEYVNDLTRDYNKECQCYKDIMRLVSCANRGLITNVEAIRAITERHIECVSNNEIVK